MKKIYLMLLMLPFTVMAGEGELTWTTPTHMCNGSPITNYDGVMLRYGQKVIHAPADTTTYTVTDLTPGTWWFGVSTVVTSGEESPFLVVEKEVLPEEFVTKTTVVYTFLRSNGNVIVIPTNHTVALGVVCDATQSVNGKYKIPLEDVTWSGPRMSAALADCG